MRRAVPDFELIRYIDTANFALVTECGACGHEATIDVQELIAAHGANLLLGELRPRLQCRQCGARTARMLMRDLPVMTTF